MRRALMIAALVVTPSLAAAQAIAPMPTPQMAPLQIAPPSTPAVGFSPGTFGAPGNLGLAGSGGAVSPGGFGVGTAGLGTAGGSTTLPGNGLSTLPGDGQSTVPGAFDSSVTPGLPSVDTTVQIPPTAFGGFPVSGDLSAAGTGGAVDLGGPGVGTEGLGSEPASATQIGVQPSSLPTTNLNDLTNPDLAATTITPGLPATATTPLPDVTPTPPTFPVPPPSNVVILQ